MSDPKETGGDDGTEKWWLTEIPNPNDSNKPAPPDEDEEDLSHEDQSHSASPMDCADSYENRSPDIKAPPRRNRNSQLKKTEGLDGKGVPFSDFRILAGNNMPYVSHHQHGKPDSIVWMPDKYPKNNSRRDSRWSVIERTLGSIPEAVDRFSFQRFFEEIILNYNGSYRYKWDFSGIASYFEQLSNADKDAFVKVLSKMGRIAVKLPSICHQTIPLLSQNCKQTIHLTRQQIACLLANAFFCTFPSRNVDPTQQRGAAHSKWTNGGPPLPTINFSSLFKTVRSDSLQAQYSKIKCIMNYFSRVTDHPQTWQKLALERVTFERRVLHNKIDWRNSESLFTKLRVTSEGTIESDAIGLAHVDFANKLVGGGVLGRGCVQEEIRFLGFTEMIVSRLFTEELMDNECLVVSGCERYNNYEGYSNTFRWTGDFRDNTEKDVCGRCLAQVIVIDARKYYNNDDQYQMFWVERELNKAYCGFKDDHSEHPAAIATGNWGCGDFRGNRHLKSLIQLMAAAEAKRDIFYFTHREKELVDDLFEVHELIKKHRLTVGDVYNIIQQYSKQGGFFDDQKQLYHFILERYTSGPP